MTAEIGRNSGHPGRLRKGAVIATVSVLRGLAHAGRAGHPDEDGLELVSPAAGRARVGDGATSVHPAGDGTTSGAVVIPVATLVPLESAMVGRVAIAVAMRTVPHARSGRIVHRARGASNPLPNQDRTMPPVFPGSDLFAMRVAVSNGPLPPSPGPIRRCAPGRKGWSWPNPSTN